MKKTMKQLFSSLLCICFLVVFSFSVGAAEALTEAIASLDTSQKYDIMEYDYVTGTKRVIPWEIFRITAAVRPLLMSLTLWLLSCRDSLK